MKLLLRLVAMVSLAFAASCGHTAVTPMTGIPLAVVNADSIPQTVHVIPFYDYGKSGYDGQGPGGNGGLIGSEAALYGATVLGGNTACSTPFGTSSSGCGIVYRLVPNTGKPTYKIDVLHKFEGAPGDGAASFATLLADKSGNLYGTTFYGGTYDGGTLFKLHPTSSGYTESIVHSFGYGQDAAYPISGVIEVKGTLYGTTVGGGAYTNTGLCKTYGGSPNGTCGTVYSVNPATGAEQVLHSFGKPGPDGANPFAALLNVGGTLYGTTDLGGALSGCGTVFSIGTDGSGERVVHSFLNNPRDGCNPFASLIAVDGSLYGTTCCGGGYYCPHCEGALFSIDLSTGKEQVLHKFGNGPDGSQPVAALLDVRGVLYGTTSIGGGTSCFSGNGCGTIFSFAPSTSSPAYKVLYNFKATGTHGNSPRDALLYSHGAFYGATTYGGKKGLGTGIKLRQ
jgi:uncharacterized repeat protein (TIGR03803 family)